MELNLGGKRALVTGSTSGIGEQIAKTLAEEKVRVIVHGRRHEEAKRVVQEITQQGGTAVAAVGELGNDEQAEQVVKDALAAFGGVDILVNNAGSFPMKPWLQTTAGEWVDLYNANAGSVVRLVTQLVPAMIEQKWGRVIMLGSFLGPMPGPPVANYGSTKAANISQAVSLAKELGGTGVTANTVSPGPIRTPGMEAGAQEMMIAQGQEYDFETSLRPEGQQKQLFAEARQSAQGPRSFEKFYVQMTRLPVGRIGSPVDIANMVAFLSSPLADFITGANFRVDGGMMPTTN